MHLRSSYYIIFILAFQFCFSQNLLSGKVIVSQEPAKGINVTNTSSGQATITNEMGEFSIAVASGDALVFSAVHLETRRIVVDEKAMKEANMDVRMAARIIPLDEVKVNENPQISAENLGIIPKGQKKYSPAERRLREATTGGGLVPLNPLLNALSGRTTMLKKEVAVEKKERLLLRLDGWFEEKYYVDHLKVPKEYIKGFHYFLIENQEFVRALKTKNKTLTKFLMQKLALDYKQTIAIP